MSPELQVAITGGVFLVISASVTSVFGWMAARRGRSASEEARTNAAYVKDQLAPSNGTKVIEYIEKNDKRMDELIELVIDARDQSAKAAIKAAEAAALTQLHEAVFRHDPKE